MPETRKFAQGLKRKAVPSTRRESSSQQIRNSVYSDYDLVSLLYDRGISLSLYAYVVTWKLMLDKL